MSSVLKRYATDPSRHLEAVFRDIERTRMAGLPILNTALAVEAIGFTPWQGHWLGALITPWFLNLVLVPGAQGEWPHAAEGERIVRQLPAGSCNFYGCFEPVIGEFHASSVCSPMSRFADQAAARAEAQRSSRCLADCAGAGRTGRERSRWRASRLFETHVTRRRALNII